MNRASASDLLASGWLPPSAAADHLGITVKELQRRSREREIQRRELSPGVYLYRVR